MRSTLKTAAGTTTPGHLLTNNPGGSWIYNVMLLFLASILLALPFVDVELYTTSRGMLRPLTERQPLTVLQAGRLSQYLIKNNHYVNQGDTLLVIENGGIDEQLLAYDRELQDMENFIVDLNNILGPRAKQHNSASLRTLKYQFAYRHFLQEYTELQIIERNARDKFDRHHKLLDSGVISLAEFEAIKHDLALAKNRLQQFRSRHRSNWENELYNYKVQVEKAKYNSEQLNASARQFTLLAPVNGHLSNVLPLSAGSSVSTGTRIAELTPDTGLIGECYLEPISIGQLQIEQEVVLMIDAFNYNQWGTVKGMITELGRDIEYVDGKPVFKVRCQISQNYIQLKSGFKGRLKQGMAFSAKILIAERSLWQLLYDKADDWINPALGSTNM